MAHNVEPMDVDCMDSDFDNKENTFHHNNLLPCTEKGYEELDVSELNMKLRYSITPAASPMSKSYTAYTDNRCLDADDSLNCTDENNLTRSLNSTITKNDSVVKSLKSLPLQSLPTEFGDRNSILKPLDTTLANTNITVTLSEANEVDENLSLPSTSSSLTHTPEATTPVNDVKNANGSPIMRGLKSVLNMFRPSQSPIPTTEDENTKPELSSLDSTMTEEKLPVLASTPIAAHRSKEGNSSRRSSPLKDSITFKDDLEKELQWKDETTIFFSQDKIPIHKLFFQNTKSVTENVPYGDTAKPVVNNLNSTVEYMDISFNDTIINDRTVSDIKADLATDKNDFHVTTESDSEFVDCETTFTNESQVENAKEIIPEIKDPLLHAAAPEIEFTHSFTETPIIDSKSVDISSIEPSKANSNPLQEVKEDTNSTISIIQELDSLLEGNNSKKDVSLSKYSIDFAALNKINEKEDEKEVIPDDAGPSNTNENIHSEEKTNLEPYFTMGSVNMQSVLPVEQQVVLESLEPEDIPVIHEAQPADVPLPDEDDIEKELKPTDDTVTALQTNTQDVVETVKADMTEVIPETVDKIDFKPTQENIPLLKESVLITNNDVLNAVDQTAPEELNEKLEKSEFKTPEIGSGDVNETDTNLSVLPDIVNQTISNDNEQQKHKAVQIGNLEETQPIYKEIQVVPLSSESVQMLELTHCDVNSTITIENNINDVLKNTTLSILESNNQIDIIQENVSLIIDNANLTIGGEINNDVPQHLTISNEYKITKEKSMISEKITDNSVDTTAVIDAKTDVELNEIANDMAVENKLEDTQEYLKDNTLPTDINTTLEINKETSTIIDTKKDAELHETAKNIDIESKLDEIQVYLKDNKPPPDINTTLESIKDTATAIDTKKDAELNEIANNIVIESKIDDTQEYLKNNMPRTDINTTLKCNVNNTAVIDTKKDAELHETAKNIDVESKLDEIQVYLKDNKPPTDINTTLESIKDTATAIDTKKDAELNEIANNIVVESKIDDTQEYLKNNMPRTDINTTLECNVDNTAVIDTKRDAEFNEIAYNIAVKSKIDDTQEYLKDNRLPTDINITLESNEDTTAVIDIRKDSELNETANTNLVVESKTDVTQERMDDNPPIDTIACNEPVNTPETPDTCESSADVEIIVSENNSPYVSVMAGINTEPEETEDHFETIENKFTSTVPSSPPIVSKGYNFNFDDIDNPFATKTKIRLSPPPDTPNKNIEPKTTPELEMPRKAPINRRKSQPPERKKTALNKKKLNTTIVAKLPNEKPIPRKETHEPTNNLKPAVHNENLNDLDLKPDANLDKATEVEFKLSDSIGAKDNSETRESETCQANDQSHKLEDGKANKLEQKSSCESSVTNISDVKTSSSEQSTYFSAPASSTESFKSKNVFNLPEIDDKNFNPFATKSKMRQSPPPLDLEEYPFDIKTNVKISPDSSLSNEKENTINRVDMEVEDKMNIEQMEKEVDISNDTSSSKTVDGRNLTTEINTEDEDTEEGPFLEAEDALDKASILGDSEFNHLPTQNEDNLEAGEMFIDAETFEFLLNQNKTNMVADSGKESLFLKFDPLFAKKISSDGVVAALSKVQKRHSTPTRARASLRNDVSPIAGPSNVNITYETNINASPEESNDDINITVSKPTMIVTPAVNPAMTPRNKSITPNRSNRRSITFTSPAMAVIDRLLSMSANNSLVDTTVTQSQNEADLALSQLRELLAEKEIDVYNLKAEGMELKERLNTMESQVKVLEADGNERLKKINDLNSQLAEKSKINKSMAAVVEEYERTIASLIAETEQDKKRHAEERMKLINERDEQTAHLASMEASFSDLHSKYEKSKQVILTFKANEKAYEKSIKDCEESMTKMENNYEMLKQHATSKLNHANSELEKINKAHEAEVLKLNALLKRNTLHITSLEETLAQKTKANDELTAICDELINKVG